MTTLPYPFGWSAGSKVRGPASSPDDCAWNVNFNNGNTNWNNHKIDGFVRAVRAGEYQDAVSLADLYAAWREARRGKRPSRNQLTFDAFWMDGMLGLQAELKEGSWRPRPSTCFIARAPKAREIHAPDFADRIVHHWLVPRLEAIYERAFIHDSYSNRRGKGTHVAVDRLQVFMRQVHSGEGGGWYLQLDIANFFNSIHRPTLYGLLKTRMLRHSLPMPIRRAVHALLQSSPADDDVVYACTAAERARVPAHKRLKNADRGCGIAIGNLSSQFFANVYLNELDQFVKHTLKARRYLRYVDDFVLIHRDRDQLLAWKGAIVTFLDKRLKLKLKEDVKLKPLSSGVDFLGYIVKATHRVVRRRVVHHARQKLRAWQLPHVRHGYLVATPAEYQGLRSVWMSYAGHFSHAASGRLYQQFHADFPWLRRALIKRPFDHRLEGHRCVVFRGPRPCP